VWASDELYLVAGVPIPSASSYEGFPQYENGIGIVRRFKDNAQRAIKRLPPSIPYPIKATIVTSTLAATIVQDYATILNKVEGVNIDVVSIRNEYFGESITVTGLITGQDIINQLEEHDLGDLVVIPSIMLREGIFLDDLTLEDISEALGRPVIPIDPTPRALADRLVRYN
jgi:NifB/MoaA-like Fe-S oxidoreductase